jgi:hypothetical protein
MRWVFEIGDEVEVVEGEWGRGEREHNLMLFSVFWLYF